MIPDVGSQLLALVFDSQIAQEHSGQFVPELSFDIGQEAVVVVGMLGQDENTRSDNAYHQKGNFYRGLRGRVMDFAPVREEEFADFVQGLPLELLTPSNESGIRMLEREKKIRAQKTAVRVVALQGNRNHCARHFHERHVLPLL